MDDVGRSELFQLDRPTCPREVVAEKLSSSGSAPHLFGERLPEFEAKLRALLLRESPEGRFCVQLSDNHLNIWRPAVPS